MPSVPSAAPEKIVFAADAPPAGWNVLRGVIEEMIYLGTHTQVVVRLPEGQSLVVHRQNGTVKVG